MSIAAAPPSPPNVVWSPWLRAIVSAAVVWHLIGVMVAPLSVPPRFEGRDSVLGSQLKTVYTPYITALYLNHAYKFFAPNPGDSHLVRYDLYFADGTKRVGRDEQLFPDRLRHWPRLLYHRHFMLTEFINDFAPPWAWNGDRPPQPTSPATQPTGATLLPPLAADGPLTPPPVTPGGEVVPSLEAAPTPEFGPPFVKTYVRAIAEYLARRENAVRVDVFYRKHLLPSIEDFNRVGKKLDSPESYRERLVLSYTVDGSKNSAGAKERTP